MKSQRAVPSDPWAPSQLPPAQQKEAKWLTRQLRMKLLGSGSCSCSLSPGRLDGNGSQRCSTRAASPELHGSSAPGVPWDILNYCRSARSIGSQYLFVTPTWQLSPLLTSITVTPLRYQLLGMWDNIFFQAILDTLLLLLFYVFNHFRADLGHD